MHVTSVKCIRNRPFRPLTTDASCRRKKCRASKTTNSIDKSRHHICHRLTQSTMRRHSAATTHVDTVPCGCSRALCPAQPTPSRARRLTRSDALPDGGRRSTVNRWSIELCRCRPMCRVLHKTQDISPEAMTAAAAPSGDWPDDVMNARRVRTACGNFRSRLVLSPTVPTRVVCVNRNGAKRLKKEPLSRVMA